MTLLDPRVWIVALLVLAGAFGAGYHRGERSGKATVHAAWDKATAQQEAAAREQTTEYRRLEIRRNNRATEIAYAIQTERQATAKTLAALRSSNRGMRADLASFAAGRDRPASDTEALAGAVARAAFLGQLLGQCREEAFEDAGVSEDLASQIRGLQSAYQSLTP